MRKLFRIRDYILLGAAATGEIFQDIRLMGDLVPNIFISRYGFVPPNYQRKSYFSTVSRMLVTDLVERKIGKNGTPYLELTALGKFETKRRFPIFEKGSSKWDGFFMQVIFDIPEKEKKSRDLLRSKLISLGFGPIQESVYISPYHFEADFNEFCVNNNFSKYVYVMQVKEVLGGDVKTLAERVWHVSRVAGNYSAIYDGIIAGTLTPKDAWKEYLDVILRDPFLPKIFLPDDFKREKLQQLLSKFSNNKVDQIIAAA